MLSWGCLQTSQPVSGVQADLKHQLGSRIRLWHRPTVDADDIQPLVRRFYRERGFRPAWTDGRHPVSDAHDLVEALKQAPREGLDLAAYSPARMDSVMRDVDPGLLGPSPSAHALAALDLNLTRSAFEYAAHVATGQIDPAALPVDWHVQRPKIDLVSQLESAVNQHRVRDFLNGLPPPDPRYGRLRAALERFRGIAASGGWAGVPQGPALRRGQRGARVIALRTRLVASGDLPAAAGTSQSFDAATAAALRRFQASHGLAQDGVVDADDLDALNVPVASRIRQIEFNMERWRWVPRDLGDRYIMVNIPGYELQLFDGGRAAFTTRVVVGKQFSPTPMFSDAITYLVINPFWNVPVKIAREELLAHAQQDPGMLQRTGMHVFSGEGADAHEIDPASVDWNTITPEDLHYSFRQEPGAANPVGHVKFMCPNQFDVYLHDTPTGHLFNASERDFSHGCVRVEHPVDLAAHLLEGVPHSSTADIEAAFASDARDSVVKLPSPVPVHLFYWTAWVDDQGNVQFRDDVYGLDHVMEAALDRRGPLAVEPLR